MPLARRDPPSPGWPAEVPHLAAHMCAPSCESRSWRDEHAPRDATLPSRPQPVDGPHLAAHVCSSKTAEQQTPRVSGATSALPSTLPPAPQTPHPAQPQPGRTSGCSRAARGPESTSSGLVSSRKRPRARRAAAFFATYSAGSGGAGPGRAARAAAGTARTLRAGCDEAADGVGEAKVTARAGRAGGGRAGPEGAGVPLDEDHLAGLPGRRSDPADGMAGPSRSDERL